MHRDEIDISTPLPMNIVNSRLMNYHIHGKNFGTLNYLIQILTQTYMKSTDRPAIMNLISYKYIAAFSLLDI